jgi:hypothetical protein
MSAETHKNRYAYVPERDKRLCARYDETRPSGLTLAALGKEFGISRTAASNILTKRDRERRRAERLKPLRDAFAKDSGKQGIRR